MKSPYETLGVPQTATKVQIKAAFKKLPRKFHPDVNPGDAAALARFKEISAANDLLKNPETRRRFDAGEIDESGATRAPQPSYREHTGRPESQGGFAAGARNGFADNSSSGFADAASMEELIARAFGSQRTGKRKPVRAKGQDVSYSLSLEFLDAANGVTQILTLADSKTLKVTIPEGAEDLQILWLKRQGMDGYGGGSPGDAYVELHIVPHSFFHRKADNTYVELPVTLRESVLGGRIDVPTVSGTVAMSVPKGSNTGTVLRLKERGPRNRKTGQRGHQFITRKVMLPSAEKPDLIAFLEGWVPKHPDTPRKEMLK